MLYILVGAPFYSGGRGGGDGLGNISKFETLVIFYLDSIAPHIDYS
jgi:hypothetical protein